MRTPALQAGLAGASRYRLHGVLGRGRRSVVYLAHHRELGHAVALKVARRAHLEAAGRGGSFAHEFELGSRLAGAGLVRMVDQGVAATEAFLAMEYMAAGPLRPAGFPVSDARAWSLLAQAAAALARLHEQGWVHRDIKPANLLLRADGTLALGDLGCACRRGERDAACRTLVGTPQYAAPEQNDGAPAHPCADIYSLGAVLHELVSARPAYPGPSLAEILGQHAVAPVPRLPAPVAHWQPLLDRMLAKEPSQRICDGAALLAELHRLREIVSPSTRIGTGAPRKSS